MPSVFTARLLFERMTDKLDVTALDCSAITGIMKTNAAVGGFVALSPSSVNSSRLQGLRREQDLVLEPRPAGL